MDLPITKAWALLNRSRDHRVSWNFGLGSEGGIEIDYDCIHDYNKNGHVNELSKELYLDLDLVLQVVKAFIEHIKTFGRDTVRRAHIRERISQAVYPPLCIKCLQQRTVDGFPHV